jgi:hypothetical protein
VVYWGSFGGGAYGKEEYLKKESGLVLQKVKEELLGFFGTIVFKTGERLKELMKGDPIARGIMGA